ncbi:hypothetical protein MHU86_25940 [Fragilaria crotonensis]|nr:hypothetical protein MHU86_25940 [Fragilaria crotonensis]
MVYVYKTPSPKAGRSVRFASSPVKSNVRLLGPTNLKSTVGQYSCTDHTNTVMVARLEPPVQGSTVERNYSSDHWANLRTAVNNLSLTAINFPLLTDSPAANLNSPLKNRSFPKSTMKNAIPPTLAPRISRSARKAEDRDAFDDDVDVRAPIGANPVPPDTPTHYPGCYAGYLPLSICDSLSCHNQIESVASNNIITFQQDNSTFSGPHFACLAVSTRRSSLLSDPTRTPDPQDEIPAQIDPQTQIFAPNEPQTAIFTHDEHGDEIPAQNDTTGENPTQNTTDSPEIHSQQLISHAETTYDEHAQTTQQLPGTQPNLAFLPPNSPETRSSHTETPSNSPPTAKSTTGPLKRFSDAFSGILTPKNVKLPHNPDATNSNPQPPISTTFSTTPKIIPTKKFSPQNLNPQPPNPSQNLSQPQNQHNEIIQPPSTKSAKPTQKSPNFGNDDQNPQNAPKSVATRPTPRQATHATFTYPPTVETFFDEDTDHDSEEDPKHIQHTSPDALTSSTRTDFTYPPIEDLTKTLLKYAKNANLCKLAYPTDLQARRRHFNTFIDNLRIVCNISPWTRQVFDLWPKQVSYSHPFVGTAIYNLIFTNVCDPCQKHIIDGPPDARTAILTLRRHCAPLTPDHVERTREAFCSIKQPHHEVATSYLNRIRLLTRDCYHAGIPNTDAELIKRTVRGGSNHSFYAASYQRFDADIRRAELNDESSATIRRTRKPSPEH